MRPRESSKLINKMRASKPSTWSTHYVLGWTLLGSLGRRAVLLVLYSIYHTNP